MVKILEVFPQVAPDANLLKWTSGEVQPLYQNFDPACLTAHQVDMHIVLLDEDDIPQARCSLWWSHIPKLSEKGLVLGHYAALNDEAATKLLEYAKKIARLQSALVLVGPMDGNTWRSYRFVTESPPVRSFDNRCYPDYFLEPRNSKQYPQHFIQAGFSPLANYSSAINSTLGMEDERVKKALLRFDQQGIKFRTLNVAIFEQELKEIFQLSLESFVHNYLYTPITEDQFLSQYKKIQSLLQPDLVLLAHDDDNLLGYLFALPDIAQQMRGEAIDTIIIKTVAVKPGRKGKGLGSVLVSEVQRRAHQAGYKKAIHALMHDDNTSTNISRHYAETIRRYTLFEYKI
ncbi:hypothetical protein MNBD_GAMMA12-2394 [hydrothermal vent metagenome]|uniref:N-acetyltransferase domain-containing protein n=1 Tax=hydrothermal vent metagenome TaxID=652676 RepID=A0A3B0ZHQ4_9ZZZZ